MIDPAAYFADLAAIFGRVQVRATDAPSLSLADGVARAVAIVREATAGGRKVIFIGNGGTAATASHQAVDFWKNGGVRAVAFNDSSLLTCIGNDFGYERVFEKPIEMFADRGDVLMAMSSSGKSENILLGVQAAEKIGCRVVTMSGFAPDNPLRGRGEVSFYVPSYAYGYVEITHLAICHAIVDVIVDGGGSARSS